MEKHQLFDMEPTKLSQTWCNDRKGKDLVSKRLEIFFILEGLIENPFSFKYHREIGEIFDCMPIILEVTKSGPWSSCPMKFNHEWIKEEDYKNLVVESWFHLE
jgi:hypothetical protein